MEQQLQDMVTVARRDATVVKRTLGQKMELLAYPMPNRDGVLFGVGYQASHSDQANVEQILKRRSAQPQRYAAWLPTQLADGGWHVVRRLLGTRPDREITAPSVDDIQTALELLA